VGIDPEYRQHAMSAAVAAVREYHDLPERMRSADRYVETIVKQITEDKRVKRYLNRVTEIKNPTAFDDLIDDAAEYVREIEPERIRALYRASLAQGLYDVLNGSERLALLAVYAHALRPDRFGGSRVIMSWRYHQRLIEVLFGRSLADTPIKAARKRIVQLGLVSVVDTGEGWNSKRTLSTVYELDLDSPLLKDPAPIAPAQELGLLAPAARRRGWVALPAEPPVLTVEMELALAEFRVGRQARKDLWLSGARPARPVAALSPVDSAPLASEPPQLPPTPEWARDLLSMSEGTTVPAQRPAPAAVAAVPAPGGWWEELRADWDLVDRKVWGCATDVAEGRESEPLEVENVHTGVCRPTARPQARRQADAVPEPDAGRLQGGRVDQVGSGLLGVPGPELPGGPPRRVDRSCAAL